MMSRRARLMTTVVALGLISAAPASNSNESAWRSSVRAFAQAHFKHPTWGYSHSLRD